MPIVTCPKCGAIVYVGLATYLCANCGYRAGTDNKGKFAGWNDPLVWMRTGWMPIAKPPHSNK